MAAVEVETAVWCPARNAYADSDVCGQQDHGHYEVEYDGNTGKVLTSPAEQERRRLAAAAGLVVWQTLARDLTHMVEHGEGAPITADDLMQHPAMRELLRRARESLHDEAYLEGASAVWRGETVNPYRFEKETS